MKKIIDSSVAIKFLARETESKKAIALFQARARQDIEFIAPEIFIYEVNHGLIRKKFRPETYAKKVVELTEFISSGLVDIIQPDAQLLKDTQYISNIVTPPKRRPWSYDATFHALAVREDSQMITADYNYIKRFDILIKDESDPERLEELKNLRQHLIGLKDINI